MNERTWTSLRRWFVGAVIAFGVLLALIGVSIAAFHLYQRHRVDRALDAIHARGEPVTPEEIPFEPRKSPSTYLDNLARCESIRKSRVDYEQDFDETNPGPLLDGARGPGLSPRVREALEELRACLDEARRDGEDVERYDWTSMEDVRDLEPSRCFAVAHRTRRILLEPSIGAIQELCRGDPWDAQASLAAWMRAEAVDRPFPDDKSLGLAIEARTLLRDAIDLSIESRSEEALSHVRTLFEGSTKVEDVPWLVGYQAWITVRRHALTGLERVLRRSPGGLDLAGLDRYLDPETPRRNLNRALLGERAVASRLFQNFKGLLEDELYGDGEAPAFLFATYLARDHAEFLERMAEAIELAREPYWEFVRSGWTETQEEELGKWELLTSMLLPRIEDHSRRCAEDEAWSLLARSALVACREGAESGRREAAKAIDPFSVDPLRTRVDPSGELVMWSVGPNLVDDGAKDVEPCDDIVWRILAR